MAGVAQTARVSGLRELQRDLNKVNKDAAKTLKKELVAAAEPTRQLAESYAFGGIRNIGHDWGRIRAGATTGSVYLVPATRRSVGSPRPNLGGLLMSESLVPAVERRGPQILEEVDDAIGRLFTTNGF